MIIPVETVKRLPAEDVVEVVRCKDCKHYHEFEEYWDCRLSRGLSDVYPNDFCSYGERKEGEDNG